MPTMEAIEQARQAVNVGHYHTAELLLKYIEPIDETILNCVDRVELERMKWLISPTGVRSEN